MEQYKKSKLHKIATFNPNAVGNTSGNIFGLPFSLEESDVIVIPVPWDVTVSSQEGTAMGPKNVFKESFQIDLFDEFHENPWKAGIAMEEYPKDIYQLNKSLRSKARTYIEFLEKTGSGEEPKQWEDTRNEINLACEQLHEKIRHKSLAYLKQNKLPVILGGDHSTPLGLIKALGESNQDFGILQIDAHADLRPAYEGFSHSHASIMYNALSVKQVSQLVQVGIRDLCNQEYELIASIPHRISTFFSGNLHKRLFGGESWKEITADIIEKLPQKVYITLDVDGMEPSFCPSTGTPVPGGLSYNQVLYIIEKLVESKKTIIGFDLVETGPEQIDGIISCRLLYKMIAMMLKSNQRI